MFLLVINSLDNKDDKKFIESLYSEYFPWLKSRAHRFVDDKHVCEDLAQDCMINIIRYIENVKAIPQDKQRAYLSVSIDNLCKNYLKHTSKIVTMNSAAAGDLDFIADNFSIEEELDKKYDYESIRAGFDKLCDRDKHIIIMKYDLELSEEQMAINLQIKKDSVRMAVGRSIKKLKREIAKQEAKK